MTVFLILYNHVYKKQSQIKYINWRHGYSTFSSSRPRGKLHGTFSRKSKKIGEQIKSHRSLDGEIFTECSFAGCKYALITDKHTDTLGLIPCGQIKWMDEWMLSNIYVVDNAIV